MLRKLVSALLILSLLWLVGCSAHYHEVGAGAQGDDWVSQRQWYILFGLVPLNDVDSKAMAAGATDYTITTEQSFVDVVISIFTSIITVHPRTVTVEK